MSFADYANAITHKTQRAAKSMLQSAVTDGGLDVVSSASIFAGMEAGTVTSKRVECVCKKATVEEYPDGNWDAELEVRCIAPAADFPTDDDFHEFAGGVFAHFFQAPSTVCENLSNETLKYTAQAVYPRSQDWDRDDDAWVSRLVLSVKCCGSVIE